MAIRARSAGRFARLLACRLLAVAILPIAVAPFATVAHAQNDFGVGSDVFPDFSLGGFGSSTNVEEPVTWSAQFYADPSGTGVIEIHAELARHWHIYSTTQKPGGPLKTKFAVKTPESVTVTGDFSPDSPPTRSVSSQYNGLTVEEHEEAVVWTAPIQVPVGFEDAITIKVDGLVCDSSDGRCMPVREQLTAQYGGPVVGKDVVGDTKLQQNDAGPAATVAMVAESAEEAAQANSPTTAKREWFRDQDYVVQWSASLTPARVMPGGNAMLTFTAKPDQGFHVYRAATDDAESSTNFVVTAKDGLLTGEPSANKPVISKAIVPSLPPVHYYAGQVTWSLPIQVPADAQPGEKTIAGLIAYQACTDNSCHRPVGLEFNAKLTVVPEGNADSTKSASVTLTAAKAATALDAAAETDWVDELATRLIAPETDNPKSNDNAGAAPIGGAVGGGGGPKPGVGSDPPIEDSIAGQVVPGATSFPIILCFAFLGGVILNVMPCVLPVVGLKIMGFVSQAGEDRRRVLLLNVVYAAGILSVFALLALLAIVFKFGWGQQFTYFPVRLGLTLGLFALALSYLGVWEIPVPGMASNKTSQAMQSREGLAGAFSKGVFATVLATPCSGPLLGYILGLTLGLSSLETAVIFFTVGLGMSLPYLLIGMQPKLIAWLPKPGNWMETFKEFMAFLFLGTVAFFFAQFQDDQKVPVFVSLLGVWFGCWIIGQVPAWSALPKRLSAWGGGIAMAVVIGVASFTYLVPGPKVLAWEDYSEARLQQLQAEGKTVLLDFSAKWCANCIYNYQVAINTEATREMIDELDAVALYADYTDFDPEIQQKLEELESRSIPLLAIYPGRSPNQPIILRDIVTQSSVLAALEKAGQSVDGPFAVAKSKRASASVALTTAADSSTSR